MGLLGKLFEKKVCDICGGEIGLLGNRKLEDGNLCKNCAGKLSPWFDERRHSTVEQIREQLTYREMNKEAVAAFHTTRTMGKNMKIHLDEKARKFMVTSAKNLQEANPDVLDISQITSCDYEVKESRYEEKQTVKDAEGKSKQVSYVPPHYTYSYDFHITIGVDHPYFDDISFNLNNMSVKIQSVGELKIGTVGAAAGVHGQSFGQVAANAAKQGIMNAVGMPTYTDPRMSNPEYVEYFNMCNEIRDTLLSARSNQMTGAAGIGAGAAAAAESPLDEVIRKGETARQVQEILDSVKPGDVTGASFFGEAVQSGPMTCPYCGANTTPDAAGNCEYCGAKIR